MENQTEKKWYQKPTAVVLLLIFFFPVGLYLMWKNEVWSKTARWIISAVFALAVIANAFKDNTCGCSENEIVEIQKSLSKSRAEAIDICCELERAAEEYNNK